MGELKQRRKTKGKQGDSKEQKASSAPPPQQQQQQQRLETQQEKRWKKNLFVMLLTCLYIPFIIVINPATVPSLYNKWTRTPCQGTCSLVDESKQKCQVDTSNLVFMRIAKTGTTTVLNVMERGLERKNVLKQDLRELEDVVSSVERGGASVDLMGYHDPSPEAYQERVKHYYTRASKTMLYPPYRAQDRTLYEGHFAYFNFTKNAERLVGPEPWFYRYMPQWLREHYHLERPDSLDVQQITFLRNPQDRIKSMYYYDRHDARTTKWREFFVQQQGNATLEECLLNETCIEKNKFRQWCSLQVEALCGVGNKCRPATRDSLEIAIQHLKDGTFLYAGITERMEESLKLLQHILPTYLEGVSLEDIPRAKSSSHIARESDFSPQAQAVLNDLCALDNDLYDYADQLLTERIQSC